MRISDWSSDVCSSDLARRAFRGTGGGGGARPDRPGTLDFGEARRSSDPRESGGAEPFLPCRGAGGGAARRRRGRKIVGRRADRRSHSARRRSCDGNGRARQQRAAVGRPRGGTARLYRRPSSDRTSGVEGKRQAVRVDVGGARAITQKK